MYYWLSNVYKVTEIGTRKPRCRKETAQCRVINPSLYSTCIETHRPILYPLTMSAQWVPRISPTFSLLLHSMDVCLEYEPTAESDTDWIHPWVN